MVLFIVHRYGLGGILSMAYALPSLTYYIRDRHENAFYENILYLDVFMLRSRKTAASHLHSPAGQVPTRSSYII